MVSIDMFVELFVQQRQSQRKQYSYGRFVHELRLSKRHDADKWYRYVRALSVTLSVF
jgi:hypothetical protein